MHRIDSVGRAERFDRGEGHEQWRLPVADQQTVEWLAWLGNQGVGGVVESGSDANGLYFVRPPLAYSLTIFLGSLAGPMPWREAVEITRKLAELLAVCEQHNAMPGPMNPNNVAFDVESGKLELRADHLVFAAVGGSAQLEATTAQSLTSRWIAPEQAAGAPWDFAGNRYVLGLVLYRLLAGESPFGGQGLRLGLEQARRGAAPMKDEISKELPPGLQSYCLRMLDPKAPSRPSTAREIADRMHAFASGEVLSSGGALPIHQSMGSSGAAVMRSSGAVRSGSRPKRSKGGEMRILGLLAGLVPVAIGVALSVFLLSRIGEAPAATDGDTPSVGDKAPLASQETTAENCASCHPRQTAQWYGSVMGHSAKSPLFQALEILIEEQVGRSDDCPHGAGVLRAADPSTACRAETGLKITGAGGELWCVNCHIPIENLLKQLPPWDAKSDESKSRLPLKDILPDADLEGIGCAFCHQVTGPVKPGNFKKGIYEGNPTWTSFVDGEVFEMRPEDRQGQPGIANSGYLLDPNELIVSSADDIEGTRIHAAPSDESKKYLRSSQFCGACHDVRLFGTDAIGIKKGEHFKRLRNAYTEWANWAELEVKAGRKPADCVDCHMSTYPGVCELGDPEPFDGKGTRNIALERACPPGTRFVARTPGSFPQGPTAVGSADKAITTHYFTGVDVPLAKELDTVTVDDPTLDANGMPLGAVQRRDLLLGKTFRFEVPAPKKQGRKLIIPVVIENVGGGHKIPAGFSQEREFWVHLTVTDATGEVIYEVGRVDSNDEDLRDKIFTRINVAESRKNDAGQPEGLFGADVEDGPDRSQWDPPPEEGGAKFRGKGIINLQNGFLRCVTCIGTIDPEGRCQPRPFQTKRRGDRFEDGKFDIDTGECTSNLDEEHRFFEVYFPVGSLDSRRGVVKGPDAIIDTRSAIHGVPLIYTYELDAKGKGPYKIVAKLNFRSFPPFLIKGFAAYEARQAAAGFRPSGPLVTLEMLERLEVVELLRVESVIE